MVKLQPEVGYGYKGSAKISENIQWESIGYMEFKREYCVFYYYL